MSAAAILPEHRSNSPQDSTTPTTQRTQKWGKYYKISHNTKAEEPETLQTLGNPDLGTAGRRKPLALTYLERKQAKEPPPWREGHRALP